eukprot:GHVU01093632.1.p1 GENE.GHVU01093632.1~~GHVU01093632.1.p1  ORF type:complete len:727 (-),score=74.55 GHVU01093632.1:438-2618(-)
MISLSTYISVSLCISLCTCFHMYVCVYLYDPCLYVLEAACTFPALNLHVFMYIMSRYQELKKELASLGQYLHCVVGELKECKSQNCHLMALLVGHNEGPRRTPRPPVGGDYSSMDRETGAVPTGMQRLHGSPSPPLGDKDPCFPPTAAAGVITQTMTPTTTDAPPHRQPSFVGISPMIREPFMNGAPVKGRSIDISSSTENMKNIFREKVNARNYKNNEEESEISPERFPDDEVAAAHELPVSSLASRIARVHAPTLQHESHDDDCNNRRRRHHQHHPRHHDHPEGVNLPAIITQKVMKAVMAQCSPKAASLLTSDGEEEPSPIPPYPIPSMGPPSYPTPRNSAECIDAKTTMRTVSVGDKERSTNNMNEALVIRINTVRRQSADPSCEIVEENGYMENENEGGKEGEGIAHQQRRRRRTRAAGTTAVVGKTGVIEVSERGSKAHGAHGHHYDESIGGYGYDNHGVNAAATAPVPSTHASLRPSRRRVNRHTDSTGAAAAHDDDGEKEDDDDYHRHNRVTRKLPGVPPKGAPNSVGCESNNRESNNKGACRMHRETSSSEATGGHRNTKKISPSEYTSVGCSTSSFTSRGITSCSSNCKANTPPAPTAAVAARLALARSNYSYHKGGTGTRRTMVEGIPSPLPFVQSLSNPAQTTTNCQTPQSVTRRGGNKTYTNTSAAVMGITAENKKNRGLQARQCRQTLPVEGGGGNGNITLDNARRRHMTPA